MEEISYVIRVTLRVWSRISQQFFIENMEKQGYIVPKEKKSDLIPTTWFV